MPQYIVKCSTQGYQDTLWARTKKDSKNKLRKMFNISDNINIKSYEIFEYGDYIPVKGE